MFCGSGSAAAPPPHVSRCMWLKPCITVHTNTSRNYQATLSQGAFYGVGFEGIPFWPVDLQPVLCRKVVSNDVSSLESGMALCLEVCKCLQ